MGAMAEGELREHRGWRKEANKGEFCESEPEIDQGRSNQKEGERCAHGWKGEKIG